MQSTVYTANLRAGFVGLRFLPELIAIGTNNLNPKLILHDGHVEYRGAFFTNSLPYASIELLNVAFVGSGTNNLTIVPRTGLTTFTGNFEKKAQLYQFLALFKAKGCPLSPFAQKTLADYQDQSQ
ncbi:hypothetical protein [Hymenobacter nivis]|uniref:YokE-like PH domain-containing protein n=1 Tax=Hymenobacter nivis TaxID=1850093 RepID=A0A502HCB5_9BACT|nr:hypothetical protein [Hymenobacter nivis]TPG72297.1 hypothetical protein EAH73_03445 [Hymenobacter nivis]